MTTTSRTTFRTLVGLNLAGRTDLTAAIDAALNDALEELSSYQWRELLSRSATEATSSDVQYVSLPSDLSELRAVQLIDAVAYSGCSVADTDDLLTLAGPTAQFVNGTKILFTAGSVPDDLALSTAYYLRQDDTGSSPNYTYTLYDTASHASTGGADGLIAIDDDATELSVLVGGGTRSYAVQILSKEEAERRYPAADMFSATDPTVCYREGSRLYLCPMPGTTAWTVRFSYDAKLSLASEADAEISADGFDSLVVARASAQVLGSIEHARESAAWWRGEYDRKLQKKLLGQRPGGAVEGVDLRLVSQPPDPRIRDPQVVWWRESR